MNVINCTDTFSQTLLLDTIKFWSENSYQHIDVLLNSGSPKGPILFKDFEESLKRLFKKFKDFYNQTEKVTNTTELLYLMNEFLATNDFFIRVLERMKFEGFNGFPGASQTVYHFIFEQKYTKELFRPIEYTPNTNPQSVLINVDFKPTGLGLNALECIYNQMYFWSLIGAEHPSIIGGVSPAEEELPKSTKDMLLKVTNEFNKINHHLSYIYSDLTKENLYKTLREFKYINVEFLKLLEQFKRKNTDYIPEKVLDKLPDLFYGVLQHIIDEHNYVLDLCKRFEAYLSK